MTEICISRTIGSADATLHGDINSNTTSTPEETFILD